MPDIPALHTKLITWFEANKEDLPWRRSRSPYHVWLAEIMLQQTQVATVIPYYEHFLSRFPTIEALAEAPLSEVLKAWEGLGYYSRARNLHRTAQIVTQAYGGEFPSQPEELTKLPGIGRYTAGAIASLAFGLDAAVLDGNIIRVLTRLFNIADDIRLASTRRQLWRLAESLLPAGRAGLWNEGLMELGQRICTPRLPTCSACPLAALCEAHQLGAEGERPVRSAGVQTPHYDVTAAVIRREDGHILIAQRPLDGMLGGLWEFPGGKRQAGESLAECLSREIREELGVEVAVGAQITTVRHAYTHFRITLYAFACTLLSGEPQPIGCADWAWVTLDELDQYAFPVTDQKIIAVLRGNSGQLSMDLPT